MSLSRCATRTNTPSTRAASFPTAASISPLPSIDSEFEERHVAHSTALQSVLKRRGSYLVGPMARYNLNFDRLPADVQALAAECGLGPTCRNPFRSIIVRAVELVYACDEALRLIADYEPPDAPFVPAEPRAGIGHGCTEAPRGMLYHRYDAGGRRQHPRGAHRPADLAEPAQHRGGFGRGRNGRDRPGRRCAARPLRTGDPQSRSVHFLFVPFPEAGGAAGVTGLLVIGIGNPDCGDDAIGPLVARLLVGHVPPEVAIVERAGDMLGLIDDWSGRDARGADRRGGADYHAGVHPSD